MTQHFSNVGSNTQTNVHFDGECISHGFTLPDGTKNSSACQKLNVPASCTFEDAVASFVYDPLGKPRLCKGDGMGAEAFRL